MIYKLTGIISEKQPSFIAVDVAGVTYEAVISLTTYSQVPNIGERVSIFTYMVVREDAISLIGFSSLEEKKLFLSLISVSNIGAKLALKILSGIGIKELKSAIVSSDVFLLSKIPGVGKKTAERVIVELRDKLEADNEIAGTKLSSLQEDVIGALVNLGFKQIDCKKATEGVDAQDDFETMLKKALKVLTGK